MWICEMSGSIKGWSHRKAQRTIPFIKAIKNTLMRGTSITKFIDVLCREG